MNSGKKRVLLTEIETDSTSHGTELTQDQCLSDIPESIAGDRSTRVGSHTSQFSHASVYTDGHFSPQRAEDFEDQATGDGRRLRFESACDDVLAEEDGETDQRGWEGSWEEEEEEEEEEEDEQTEEIRDSDYDTDLEMNPDKWLHPEKYSHDTTGLTKYLQACKDHGVQPIKYFLRHMQDEELKFRYRWLGPKAMGALAVPLETNTTIEQLDLAGNFILSEGTLHLCRVLRENVYVTDLNLSENKIENAGATAVCNLLIDNRTIERLDLSGNFISDSTGEIFHELLTQKNPSLKYLNLRHNKLEDGAAAWFKEAIMDNETLEHLDLSWNHFQCKGCVMLAQGLKENVGLKEFGLAMNGFGLKGGQELGEAIFTNRTLLMLDVSYCRLPVECVAFLSHGLEHNDALRFLDVSYNCLTADGAAFIVQSIKNNDSSNLQMLNFGNTRVHDKTEEMCQELKEERNMVVRHGGIVEEYRKDHHTVDPMEAFKRDPFTKLREWVESAGYRLIDLLRHFDKDQSMSISIDEFRQGIKSTSLDLTEEQMQILISRLDTDGDGEIDFSELVEGDKDHRKTKRDIEKRMREIENLEKMRERAAEDEKSMIKERMDAAMAAARGRRESKVLLDQLFEYDFSTPRSSTS